MSDMKLRQKCPMCDEMLDYDVTSHPIDSVDEDGKAVFAIEAQTTKESTAHVWTHAPA